MRDLVLVLFFNLFGKISWSITQKQKKKFYRKRIDEGASVRTPFEFPLESVGRTQSNRKSLDACISLYFVLSAKSYGVCKWP